MGVILPSLLMVFLLLKFVKGGGASTIVQSRGGGREKRETNGRPRSLEQLYELLPWHPVTSRHALRWRWWEERSDRPTGCRSLYRGYGLFMVVSPPSLLKETLSGRTCQPSNTIASNGKARTDLREAQTQEFDRPYPWAIWTKQTTF